MLHALAAIDDRLAAALLHEFLEGKLEALLAAVGADGGLVVMDVGEGPVEVEGLTPCPCASRLNSCTQFSNPAEVLPQDAAFAASGIPSSNPPATSCHSRFCEAHSVSPNSYRGAIAVTVFNGAQTLESQGITRV